MGFEKGTKGFTVLGSFIVIILVLLLAYMAYWCKYQEGREKCIGCMEDRERKRVAIKELPDDKEFLKARVAALSEHTGLPVEEEDEAGEKGAEEEVTPNFEMLVNINKMCTITLTVDIGWFCRCL